MNRVRWTGRSAIGVLLGTVDGAGGADVVIREAAAWEESERVA